MRNIKLILEYDGTGFFGFQKQPRQPTIQGELEKALFRLFRQNIKIKSASGRTDSGVHAACQVVHFLTDAPMACRQIQTGLNHFLPASISVMSVTEESEKFHARYQAKKKIYTYSVWNHLSRSPLRDAFFYHLPISLDLKKMKKAARGLIGKHDFRSFQANSQAGKKSSVRTVYRLDIKKRGDVIEFEVEGNGFLHHMVRNMVGTLIEVGMGRIEAREVSRILRAKDRRKAGYTVPAKGLLLKDVTYGE